MIVCVAVVGAQNNPLSLCLTSGRSEDASKFHYIVHCSLDAVEEKVLLRRSPGDAPDSYLGLLYPTDQYRVFGYITNSHTKLILVLDELEPKDDELIKVFKRLHTLYVDATFNPFYTYGTPLTSATFHSGVEAIVKSYVAA